MPIPTLLATFDGSLAYRDRNGVATLTSSGPVRYEPGLGPGSQAYVAEEATTNRIRDPFFQHGSTYWFESSNIDPVEQDTAVTREDVPSGRFVRNSVVSDLVVTIPSADYAGILAGTVVTWSVWVQASQSGRQVAPAFTFRDAGGAFVSNTAGSWQEASTDDWTLLELTATTPAGSDRVQPEVRGSATNAQVGDIFWIVQPQAEHKPYRTSFCPRVDGSGTLLPGYTWAGTAHASASTRQATRLRTPVEGKVAPDRGSIMVRFRRHYATDSFQQYIACIGAYGASDWLGLNVRVSDGRPRVSIRTNDATLVTKEAQNPLPVGEFGVLYVEWDGDTIGVALNDEPVSHMTYQRSQQVGGNVEVGSFGDAQQLNGSVDALVIFNRLLSDTERAALESQSQWRWSSLIPTPGGVMRVGPGGAPFGVMRIGYGEGD